MSKKADDFFSSMKDVAGKTTERKTRSTNSNGTPGSTGPEFYSSEDEPKRETDDPEDDPKYNNPGNLSEEKIKASGKTGAILTGDCIETVFTLTNMVMYITKFKGQEKKRIIELDEIEKEKWSEEDHRLNRKFLALTKRRDEVAAKIPFSQKEIDALAEGFSQYTRVTGKSMNPQLIIWSTIIKAITSRGIDVFM